MERKKAVHHPAAERECHRLKAFPARRAEVHPGAGPVKRCLPCTAGFVLRSLRAASAEGMGHSILLNRSGTAVLPSSEYRRRWGLFYTIGNFISYRIKTSGGSHCGGKEDVAYTTRRAGNLRLPGESRKRDSFLYDMKFYFLSYEKRRSAVDAHLARRQSPGERRLPVRSAGAV